MSLRFVPIFIAGILWSTAALAEPGVEPQAVTMAQLDAIMIKAKSVDGFLQDPALQRRYIKLLVKYYGDDNDEGYWAIIDQLRKTVRKVPGLRARLWETTNLGTAFEIQTAIRTSGRDLNALVWSDYVQAWKSKIDAGRGEWAELLPANRDKKLAELGEKFSRDLSTQQARVAGLPKRQAEIEMGRFFQSEKQNPAYVMAAASLLAELLRSEKIRDPFESRDPDIILETIDNLKQNTENAIGSSPAAPVLTQLRALLPGKQELLAREDMFPIKTRQVRNGSLIPVGSGSLQAYMFEPIPRRIHGIFKGVSLGECVGGGSTDNLTAERWGTVCLSNTQLYHVHQGDSYLGFVQLVPISRGGKTYGSVDFGAGVLGRKVIVKNSDGNGASSMSLFDLWFKEARRHLPENWSGVVVGESHAIGNAGVVQKVQASAKYILGPTAGEAKSFRRTDPLGTKIIKASKKPETYSSYGGRMIFDGMVPDAGQLRQLVNADPALLQNPKKINAALRNGNSEYRATILRMLTAGNSIENAETIQLLRELMNSGLTHDLARKALIADTSMAAAVIDAKLDIALGETSGESRDAIVIQFLRAKLFPAKLTQFLLLDMFNIVGESSTSVYERYLSGAPLTHAQVDAFREAYLNLKKPLEPFQNVLLETDYDKTRTRVVLEEIIATTQNEYRRTASVQKFVRLFAADSSACIKWSKILAEKNFLDPHTNSSSRFEDTFNVLTSQLSPEDLKAFLFELLSKGKDNYRATSLIGPELLRRFKLSVAELAQLQQNYNFFTRVESLPLAIAMVPRPSPKFVEMMFHAYLRTDDSVGSYKQMMMDYFKTNTEEEEQQVLRQAAEVLGSQEPVATLDNKVYELRRVAEVLAFRDIAIPRWLQEKILSFLKDAPESRYDDRFGWVFSRFDLNDASIVSRIEDVYVHKKAAPSSALVALVELLPFHTPAFVETVRAYAEGEGSGEEAKRAAKYLKSRRPKTCEEYLATRAARRP
jgi:hypothetical protein